MRTFKLLSVVLVSWALALSALALDEVRLNVGNSKLLPLKAVEKLAIGNPEIADVKQLSADEVLLTAKRIGLTTLILYFNDGRKDMLSVTVGASKAGQTMVQIDVQVMEISKTDDLDVGLNWEKISGPAGSLTLKETTAPINSLGTLERGKLDLVLTLLQAKGNAKILARPKLLTLSGAKASFSAGGEIPYSTVGTNGQTNVEWKKYGVNLDMLPTVNAAGEVDVDLRAEVSEVDFTHLVQGNPAIRTRWASTTLHVQPDTTVVIGGLVQDKDQMVSQGLPLWQDLPVIGYLFKSTRMITEESELVIFVTPRVMGR